MTVVPEVLSQHYAVTLTLRPFMNTLRLKRQFMRSWDFILARLHDSGVIVEDMRAELTANYNIHYHGIVRFKLPVKTTPVRKWYDIWRKINKTSPVGFTKIDIITDYHGWYEYITKDHSKTIQELSPYYKYIDSSVLVLFDEGSNTAASLRSEPKETKPCGV